MPTEKKVVGSQNSHHYRDIPELTGVLVREVWGAPELSTPLLLIR